LTGGSLRRLPGPFDSRSPFALISVRSLTMEILSVKPDSKRPVIVRVATSLFAKHGIDGTSMRDIADKAGVREAAIYRHFAGKDDLAREIFLSWYGWYCDKLQHIVSGAGATVDKLRGIVRHEFSAATDHREAFVYFCENEARFVRDLPPEIVCARRLLMMFIKTGQADGDVRAGSADLLADMLSGALCTVALTWLDIGRRKKLNAQIDEVVQGCWRMIAT
jgi:AcrR family transcriptional regulator